MYLLQFMRPSNASRTSSAGRTNEDMSECSGASRCRSRRAKKIERWIAARVKLTRSSSGLKAATQNGSDRKPPARPTAPEFPRYSSTGNLRPFTKEAADHIYALFSTVHGAAAIKNKHLEALNITCEEGISLNAFVPDASLLPPDAEPPIEGAASGPSFMLSTGRPAPGWDVFWSRAKDLLVDNEAAFCAAQRVPPPKGKGPVKLGSFFKFWLGLEYMGQYWDSSRDHYYEEEVYEQGDGEKSDGNASKKRKRERYEGHRIGTGKEMPDVYREDTVRDLLDPIVYLFGCQTLPPRVTPRVTLRNTLFPVRVTHSVYRTPSDRTKARKGFVEGPVIAIQCRPEISFNTRDTGDSVGPEDRLNLLRELAGALLVAQERSREGKPMLRPGEGQWYTTVPRWGGGPGGEVGEAAGITDEIEPVKGDRNPRRSKTRKELNAEAYKKVEPGMGTWDIRTEFKHIGKDAAEPIDHIYLFSSLNHHVSIVDFRFHAAYLGVLDSGKVPDGSMDTSDGVPWYELNMRRTRWYDLFKAEDRIEVLRGLWAIMGFMMRENTRRASPEL
ncbi:MAG: hypothetical protein M4579_006212 [Chaenotheca gracillima]|nr:MAG: hypothetical protein M4579_006212 [Chaenotheca gracillima]